MDDRKGSKERMTYIIMSIKLGTAKVYFKNEDLGKMLKLKDKDNLMITDVSVDNTEGKLTVTITTPMDNITNDRVRTPNGTARDRLSPKLFSDDKRDYNELSITELYDECVKNQITFTKEELDNIMNRLNGSVDHGNILLSVLMAKKLREKKKDNKRGTEYVKIFEYLKQGIFEEIENTEIKIPKYIYFNSFDRCNNNETEQYLVDTFKENYNPTKDLEDIRGLIMIDGKAMYSYYFCEEEFVLDCIELPLMISFIRWYRKEYNDDSFNGSDRITNLFGYIE
jgi:hypothetical protein